MSEPIRSKIAEISEAPTPQNTPASNAGSLLSRSNIQNPNVPKTIDEESEEVTKKKLLTNPNFMSLIEGKLNTLVGQDSGYVASFPEVVKNRIISLKSLQKKQMDLEYEFQKELFALEKKYTEKAKPLNLHRKKIINGEVEPTEEEIQEGKAIEAELEGSDEEDSEEEEEDEDENKIEELETEKSKKEEKKEGEEEKKQEEDKNIKGIPDFWLTALENLSPICDTITERDAEVLHHLIDIRLEHLDKPGFKLIFEFNENEFFTNKVLEKTYYYQEELGYTGEFIYDHAEGDEIKWVSPEQNVTIKIERRKQRNKHTKQTRTIEKLTPIESFFNFFDPPKPPTVTGNEEDDEDEEEEEVDDEELEARLQLDYHIAEEIKDKLITRAVDWFTGAAIDFVEYEEPDYFDEDESDDDDDDDDSDSESEEEEDKVKQKDPQECKQQ